MKFIFLANIILLIIINIVSSCDIFIASKCPSPPAQVQVNQNWTAFCEDTKGHVDCINKKLKQCKKIQEFGPALETMKWNIKVIINQAKDHGCPGLIDKIKLPRIPRKKSTTQSSTLATEKTVLYIDPNCNRNLADMYCEKLDPPLMSYLFNDTQYETASNFNSYINEVGCKVITKYYQCLQLNFRIKCSQTLSKTFLKMETLNGKCINKNFNKKILILKNNSNRLAKAINCYSFLLIFISVFNINFRF